jgi:hypothetical protein
MIDSADRTSGASAWDFTVAKNQNLANGFFTRLGATEVVIEWAIPNIEDGDTLIFALSSGGPVTVTFSSASVNGQFLNVAGVLDQCVEALGVGFSVAQSFGVYGILNSNPAIAFTAVTGTLANKMNFDTGSAFTFPQAPDLRLYRVLDILSSDMTYNQNVKDSQTSASENNVLVRWYMANDIATAVDKYGYPVLMGYEPFQLRRLYNPPKQIAWTPNMLIGNITFKVLGVLNKPFPAQTNPVTVSGPGEWLMTIQLSEN